MKGLDCQAVNASLNGMQEDAFRNKTNYLDQIPFTVTMPDGTVHLCKGSELILSTNGNHYTVTLGEKLT